MNNSVVPDKYRMTHPRVDGFLDIYDILEMCKVIDHELAHAAKKILCAGRRGKGDQSQDVSEAIQALQRWQERKVISDKQMDEAIFEEPKCNHLTVAVDFGLTKGVRCGTCDQCRKRVWFDGLFQTWKTDSEAE